MVIFESFKIAWRSLGSNKVRTGLTMLGMVIGVGAVIAMLAIGQGASNRISATINSMGTNLLTVQPGNPRMRGGFGGAGQAITTLSVDDATAISHNLSDSVAMVGPAARGGVTLKMGNQNTQTSLIGTVPAYGPINNTSVRAGRFISTDDDRGRLKTVVVGQTIVQELLGSADINPIGQDIEINRIQFKIVGVLTPKGTTQFGQDQDDTVIVPLSTALRRVLNRTYVSTLYVECKSEKKMDLATQQITALLRRRHHLQPPFPDNDDFSVRNQTAFLDMSQTVTNTMTALLGGVAVVSLIVGGIGIMNIMIVSVTERTREIGLRKAVGATEHAIMLQFLTESLVISVLGGLIGIAFGVLGSKIVGALLGWPAAVSMRSVVLSFGVSGGIGLFFGIYPARKAGRLAPIEALRSE
jgi:putative ABC transport system permease protein